MYLTFQSKRYSNIQESFHALHILFDNKSLRNFIHEKQKEKEN